MDILKGGSSEWTNGDEGVKIPKKMTFFLNVPKSSNRRELVNVVLLVSMSMVRAAVSRHIIKCSYKPLIIKLDCVIQKNRPKLTYMESWSVFCHARPNEYGTVEVVSYCYVLASVVAFRFAPGKLARHARTY